MATVQLYHADCLDVLREMKPGSVDAVVCDPPYLTTAAGVELNHPGVAAVLRPTQTVAMPWGYSLDWVEAVAELAPLHWVVFCNYQMLGDLHAALARHAQISSVFVWQKPNAPQMTRPVPRLDCEFIIWARRKDASCGRMREFKSLVLNVPMPQAGCFATERILEHGSGRASHPCQKPLAVVRPFVERLTDPGDVVLDCFAGTGTTGVACVQTGRNFIGIEIDPTYFAIAKRRIEAAQAEVVSEAAFLTGQGLEGVREEAPPKERQLWEAP